MEIIIDPRSGFCFGVKRAIELAEKCSKENTGLYCLGEIVHNSEEVKRLESQGITFINRDQYFRLSDCTVLFRAHGEPPETYEYARKNNIRIIDATCPVVLKFQDKVRNARRLVPDTQVVIYGKRDHPEVIGLLGQMQDAFVVEAPGELPQLNYSRPVSLFAQTTKDRDLYETIKQEIAGRLKSQDLLKVTRSICGQVANRGPWLAGFSKTVDTLIFVGGKNSSNSRVLFGICKQHNPQSYFVTSASEIKDLKLQGMNTIGISGATSTPSWLIEEVADTIRKQTSPDSIQQ